MGTYPKVWLGSVDLTDPGGRWGLDPSHPPRLVNVPEITSVRVPGRDGSLWTPQGAHPSPLFTAVVLVAGSGLGRDAQFADTQAIVEMLSAVASMPKVPIRYQVSDNRNRYADGRISTFDNPQPDLDYAVVTMVFELLDPFWTDTLTASTVAIAVGGSGVANLPPQFVGTAPILDAVVTVVGPAVNPRVTDTGSGDWFFYAGTVGDGQRLELDSRSLRARLNGAVVDAQVTIGGSGAYIPSAFRIAPFQVTGGSAGSAQLTVTAGGMSSATRLQVQARRAFR